MVRLIRNLDTCRIGGQAADWATFSVTCPHNSPPLLPFALSLLSTNPIVTSTGSLALEMESCGSITGYFQYIDSESQRELHSIMSDSYNYVHFVRKLTKEVLTESASPLLVYLTTLFCESLNDIKKLNSLSEKYPNIHIVEPHFLMAQSALGHIGNLEVVGEIAEDVVRTQPEDWISFNMHLLRCDSAQSMSIGSVQEEDALEMMKKLIHRNGALEFFKPKYLQRVAMRFRNEGELDQAFGLCEQALEILRKYDHRVDMPPILAEIAFFLREYDTEQAMNLLDLATDIRNSLGIIPSEDYGILNVRAGVHNNRGEYNASIDYYLTAIKQRDSIHHLQTYRYLPVNLANIYSAMGMREDALEWARMALESRPFMTNLPLFDSMVHLAMANTLVQFGNTEEAIRHLDIARRLSLAVGSDKLTARISMVEGVIEKQLGDIQAARRSFEKALRIFEDMPKQTRINSCLINLVKLELIEFSHKDVTQSAEVSGPWMTRLNEMVREKDMIGIKGQALLFTAELRLKQKRFKEAAKLLEEVESIGRKSSCAYLNDLVADLLTQTKLIDQK